MEGNEIADGAAKQAATDQIQDDDYPFEHSITFRHKESGVRCGLQGLIQWLRETFKKQRRQKLTEPADPTKSQHCAYAGSKPRQVPHNK